MAGPRQGEGDCSVSSLWGGSAQGVGRTCFARVPGHAPGSLPGVDLNLPKVQPEPQGPASASMLHGCMAPLTAELDAAGRCAAVKKAGGPLALLRLSWHGDTACRLRQGVGAEPHVPPRSCMHAMLSGMQLRSKWPGRVCWGGWLSDGPQHTPACDTAPPLTRPPSSAVCRAV